MGTGIGSGGRDPGGRRVRRQAAGHRAPDDVHGERGGWGGMAALHLAVRQGAFDAVTALVEGGADINLPSVGNLATPLATAALNGQFDIAKYLLEKGADPNLQEDNGETPLYAVINLQWASKNFFPHPRAHLQQRTGYLELMRALLDKGADPDLRTTRKVWTSNFADYDTSGVDDAGATPFWRAAYAADVAAMKLLLEHGADPTIPTAKTFGRATLENGDERSKGSGPAVPLGGTLDSSAACSRRAWIRGQFGGERASGGRDRHARGSKAPGRAGPCRRQQPGRRWKHAASQCGSSWGQRDDSSTSSRRVLTHTRSTRTGRRPSTWRMGRAHARCHTRTPSLCSKSWGSRTTIAA